MVIDILEVLDVLDLLDVRGVLDLLDVRDILDVLDLLDEDSFNPLIAVERDDIKHNVWYLSNL